MMSLLIVFGLITFGLVSTVFSRRRIAVIFLLLAMVAIELIGGGWLPSLAFRGLAIEQPRGSESTGLSGHLWSHRNAIVLLGAGADRTGTDQNGADQSVRSNIFGVSRAMAAAAVYHECKQGSSVRLCNLIVSGGDPARLGIAEAEILKRELIGIGVASDDVIVEEQSRNTFENARNVAGLLKAGEPYGYIALVTSAFHLRRSLLFFEFFGIKPVAVPADESMPRLTIVPRASAFVIFDLALHEYLGIAKFYVYSAMGWNEKI